MIHIWRHVTRKAKTFQTANRLIVHSIFSYVERESKNNFNQHFEAISLVHWTVKNVVNSVDPTQPQWKSAVLATINAAKLIAYAAAKTAQTTSTTGTQTAKTISTQSGITPVIYSTVSPSIITTKTTAITAAIPVYTSRGMTYKWLHKQSNKQTNHDKLIFLILTLVEYNETHINMDGEIKHSLFDETS